MHIKPPNLALRPALPDQKVARIIIHPDGRQEIIYVEDESDDFTFGDALKHPALTTSTTALLAANTISGMSQSALSKTLQDQIHINQPISGWDNLTTTVKDLASDPNVVNVTVSVLGATASYPFWYYGFTKLGVPAEHVSTAAWVGAVMVGVPLFTLLTFETTPKLTKAECKAGFSKYSGPINKQVFNETCKRME